MIRFRFLAFFVALIAGPSFVFANDPGLEKIGSFGVQLIYATNGDIKAAGEQAKEQQVKEISKIAELKFAKYRLIGSDKKPILRGYENWATPLKPSKEILINFEPRKELDGERFQMLLEYWQGGRKILTTDPILKKGKSLYLLGPEWRKGRLILEVKILELI